MGGVNGCETVTIHYEVGWIPLDIIDDRITNLVVELPAFNAQGTVNGDVKNGNGVWTTQIVFTGVAARSWLPGRDPCGGTMR